MVRLADLIVSYLIVASASGDRAQECADVCGARMSAACCECLGCHQGMRFGKRAAPPLNVEQRPIHAEEREHVPEVSRHSQTHRSPLHSLNNIRTMSKRSFRRLMQQNDYVIPY